jgi:hypothetical protein
MKKMIIAFMVALVSVNSNTFEDLQSTPPTLQFDQHNVFLEANTSAGEEAIEYAQNEEEKEKESTAVVIDEESENMEEYDQNVTDNVNAPKISNAEALIRQALGELLIRYISLKEVASVYFAEIKDAFFHWYQNIVKAQ